jgi:hypothetical protein
VRQPGLAVHADVQLHAEKPLLALSGRVHLQKTADFTSVVMCQEQITPGRTAILLEAGVLNSGCGKGLLRNAPPKANASIAVDLMSVALRPGGTRRL